MFTCARVSFLMQLQGSARIPVPKNTSGGLFPIIFRNAEEINTKLIIKLILKADVKCHFRCDSIFLVQFSFTNLIV